MEGKGINRRNDVTKTFGNRADVVDKSTNSKN